MILQYCYSTTKPIFTLPEVDKIISMGEINLEDAKIDSTEAAIQGHRNSSISWFKRNPDTEFIYKPLLEMIHLENINNKWNFDYDAIEDLQFTTYGPEQHYNWHADQRSVPYADADKYLQGKIRKISFSVLLNHEYEGGEFEFELGLPHDENRTELCQVKTGEAIVFPSFTYHRVRPVTKGKRYSLVGWICGKPYR